MTNEGKRTGNLALTVIVAVLMVMSVALVAVAAVPTASAAQRATGSAQGAAGFVTPPTATGTVTYNPTTFGTATSTIVVATGGTFGSGSTVYIYGSTTNAASGITDSTTPLNGVSGTTLPGGATSFSSTVIKFTTAPGPTDLYLLASDSNPSTTVGAQFTVASPITVVVTQPTVVSPGTGTSAVIVGTTAQVTGNGWDAGATVVVTLNSPGGTPQLATATVLGNTKFTATFTVPALSGTVDTAGGTLVPAYNVVVQEANALSASFPQGGITADTTMDVAPSITISPISTTGASGSVFTITGAGFVAGQGIAASTIATLTSSITIGGVSTYHSAETAGATGAFTATVTLAAAIAGSKTIGPVSVVITLTAPAATDTFADAVYVSVPNPTALGFAFSAPSAVPGSALMAAVWNFPAGATVTISLGSQVIGTITTDSNGFGELAAVVPAMPAATYTPVAADVAAGLYASAAGVPVGAFFSVLDPVGSYLTAEYFPSTGVYTVEAYGLTPTTDYTLYDSGGGGLAAISVSIGTLDSTATGVFSALNGTAIFSVTPNYPGVSTGVAETIALGAITPSPAPFGYVEFGAPTFTSPTAYEIYTPGLAGQTFAVGNLIPDGAAVYPGSTGVPAASYLYSAYFGSTLLSFGTPSSSVFHGGTAPPASASFTTSTLLVPSVAIGVYAVSIVSAGTPVSAALNAQPVVVSTVGASVSDGTLLLVPTANGMGYYAVGVGLDGAATTVNLYYMTIAGSSTGVSELSLTHGAFVDTSTLSVVLMTAEPAGTYSIFLEVATATATAYIYATPYAITAALTLTGPAPATCTTTLPCDLAGDPSASTYAATGLTPDGYYDFYLGGQLVATQVQADGTGSIGMTSFTVPELFPGVYTASLDDSGTTTVVTSALFEVAASPTITLVTGGADQSFAFPGELLAYDWTPAVAPSPGIPVTVTVLLNGTAYVTEPATFDVATGTLSGTFAMPNACSGSATTCVGTYWGVTFTWNQESVSAGGSVFSSYTEPTFDAAFLQLVSGSGGVVLSISQSDMVEIATLSGANVNITLANLGAKISGIYALGNKTYASLTSGFGNMTVSLKDINAIVTANAAGIANIENGIVTLKSDVGQIQVNLTAIGATVSKISANVIVLNTTVGQINTNLTALNAKVVSVEAGIATLTTDVSQIQVSLTAINATVQANAAGIANIENGIVTLSSTLGTMTAALSAIGATVMTVSANVIVLNTTVGQINTNLTALNAKVVSVEAGIATLTSDVGTISVNLAAIGAQLTSFQTSTAGSFATITSTLGTFKATLGAINATVVSTANQVAVAVGDLVVVKTDLGAINGTVTAINGSVATIQSQLGTLQASVNGIPTTNTAAALNTAMLLLYVVIVLVIITLALAAVLLSRVGQRRPPAEPPKVYEAPKTP